MCHGSGKISSSLLIDDTLERELAYYVENNKITSFILKVNPILSAYLTKGLFSSIAKKWSKKYSCKLKIDTITDFALLQTEWCDSKGEKLP